MVAMRPCPSHLQKRWGGTWSYQLVLHPISLPPRCCAKFSQTSLLACLLKPTNRASGGSVIERLPSAQVMILGPGIEFHMGLPQGAYFSLCLCLCLSLGLMNKI